MVGSLFNADAKVNNSPAQYVPVSLAAELGYDKIVSLLCLCLAPWALLGLEAGSKNGTFGMCGARTEQLAIGLIIYYMTGDYKPGNPTEGGPVVVKCLQNMDFPELDGGDVDWITESC